MAQRKNYKTIKVIDLFAGVGGFRVGLKRASGHKALFKNIWSNQWEPSTKTQHASDIYVSKFGSDGHSNVDIAIEVKNNNVPNHDMLCGGFPCQDYSVARTLSQAAGINGKKGVLWWEIYKIIKNKTKEGNPTKYLFLENVDRLLKSPAPQRGRDFAIILSCLSELGYVAEWRVINAADYGFPQRRRRTYILAYKERTKLYRNFIKTLKKNSDGTKKLLLNNGVMPKAFPVICDGVLNQGKLDVDIKKVSDKFNSIKKGARSPFENAGIMHNGKFFTIKTKAVYKRNFQTLGDIIIPLKNVPLEFHIRKSDLPKWKYLKGAKNQPRKSKTGHTFIYTEGSMVFPDPLDRPSRTIITGEGGPTPSRFKHVIEQDGILRRLTPLELELLCGFPDNHTAGQSDTKRAFFMGNSLVVGVIEKIGKELLRNI